MTQSAASQAPQVALSQPSFWALTQRHQPFSALLLACSAMTRAFAAKLNTTALSGRFNTESRRQGFPLATAF
jgi:hypothetical protein